MAHRTPTSSTKKVGYEKVATLLSTTIEIPRNGYLYIYTSNETKNIDVYFDNLQLSHTRSPLLEENNYYAFGGDIKALCSKAMKGLAYINNNAKFNSGTEFNDDLDVALYETPFRNYNAQIGRFYGLDKLAESRPWLTPMHFGGNNPISFNDPTGLEKSDSGNPWEDAVEALLGGNYGGTWNILDGWHLFGSGDEAFGYGASIMGQYGMWGAYDGWATSMDNALDRYNGGYLTEGMVTGLYEQRLGGSGYYDIAANYAGGIHAGQGFNIGWSYNTSNFSESDLEDVGKGSRFASTATIMGMFNGNIDINVAQNSESNFNTENIMAATFVFSASSVELPPLAVGALAVGSAVVLGKQVYDQIAGNGNSSYPGPWHYTYRPPSLDPINDAYQGFDPKKPPLDGRGAARWLLVGGFLYDLYDKHHSTVEKESPFLNPQDTNKHHFYYSPLKK